MKKVLSAFVLLFLAHISFAQQQAFRFAFLSDTHISTRNATPAEDLRRTINDINSMQDIIFVVLTGDITELGMNEELALAKELLDSLHIKYYIIPGNHDTGWSESGGVQFANVFGYDQFSFTYGGIHFLGCPSGPYVRMSDGHIPRSSLNWLDKELKKINNKEPVIFLNHYPIDNGLDNWYEITDRLKKYNTWAILCGHGHSNKAMNFEGIPGVMGRSNLRAKALTGGYNLVDVTADSIIFSEKTPGVERARRWTAVQIVNNRAYGSKQFLRPDYTINQQYTNVQERWRFAASANIISTPAVNDKMVFVGDQSGSMMAISLANGKQQWSYNTGAAIFSSPAFTNDKIVFGSGNGSVYCLDAGTGKLDWRVTTAASVLGSPLIVNNDVYIGGSDHSFRKLDLPSGKQVWKFDGLAGPVVSTPVFYNDRIIFGAWDRNLYALNGKDGTLAWKWNNGSTVINYSPAACTPVVSNNAVYIVAPDKYISSINSETGETLWRNNDAAVRESIGMSTDGKWLFTKTMQDTVAVYAAGRDKQYAVWKMHVGFGYEHVPSMLIEKEGYLYFGTRSGVVYCIDIAAKKIRWAHKIDNSMVNTVRVIDVHHVVASTMDGKLVLLESE